jgi:hypothetical protein
VQETVQGLKFLQGSVSSVGRSFNEFTQGITESKALHKVTCQTKKILGISKITSIEPELESKLRQTNFASIIKFSGK